MEVLRLEGFDRRIRYARSDNESGYSLKCGVHPWHFSINLIRRHRLRLGYSNDLSTKTRLIDYNLPKVEGE